MQKITKTQNQITIKPEVRFGKPCIKNTRIAIADILNLVKAGYIINDIPKQYSCVSLQSVKLALEYASNILGKEEILAIN